MSEVDPSRAKKISSYDGFVIEWNDNGEDITFDAVIEEAGKYQIAVDYLSLQTTVANISINVLVNGKTEEETAEKDFFLGLACCNCDLVGFYASPCRKGGGA